MSGVSWQAPAPRKPGREGEWDVDCRFHGAARVPLRRNGPKNQADGQGRNHRRPDRARDRRAPAVPARSGAGLHLARPLGRHSLRWRRAAHPPRHTNWLQAARRALRAGRAFHRPAPSRQRPPAGRARKPARPRQHRPGGRARRRDHPPRRLCDRPRSRRRSPRR